MWNAQPFCNNPEVCKHTLIIDTSDKGGNERGSRPPSAKSEENHHACARVGVKLRPRTTAAGTHLLLHQLQFGAAEVAASAAPLFLPAAGRR